MEIGDRVKVIDCRNIPNKNVRLGDTGTIIDYEVKKIRKTEIVMYNVEFDRDIEGHDGLGNGKVGHCSWLGSRKIKKI